METLSPAGDSPFRPVSTPPSRLVGRLGELALALALLRRPDVRLLTLTGPGGIGKTRLALSVSAELSPDFPDGVCFVSLAEVTNAALVGNTVARAAGLLDAGDTPVRDRLVTALRDAESLLVLDNFEHVVAAAPLVSDLLAICQRLKILVTSRALLRVDGEHALPVPPLAVPAVSAVGSARSVQDSAAVQLFVQRCQAVSPSFIVTDDNAPLVADICRRLDGVPLAIELAAARVTHLSLATLSARLEPRLPLLTGGGRDRPPRLQTMRNAIAWSHDLLSTDEQALFRRLAVFAGGCSLEAAEDVGGGGSPSGHPAALDLIAALVDASLLQVETDGYGTTRYRMLETIRDFALEQLVASGEEDQVRDRHAAYFVAFATRHESAGLLPGDSQVLARLEAEHPNLRLTLARLATHDQAATLLSVASALGNFWMAQGYYHEGRGWLEHALARADTTALVDRAKALVGLGIIEAYQGLIQEAETHLSEGLAACRNLGQPFTEAYALMGLGALSVQRGDHARGMELLEECLTLARAVPNQRLADIMSGWGLMNLATISREQGDDRRAGAQLEAALRLERKAGHTAGTIMVLGDLGDVWRDQADHARAMACYREALALGQEHPGGRVVTEVIEAVGIAVIATGEATRGAILLGAAEALRERIGLHFRVKKTTMALEQAVAASRASLGERRFATVWSEGRNLTPADAVAAALAPIGSGGRTASVSLTPREAEVLQLLASGMTDPAIAAALFISVRTVENHVARIFAKLGVHTRTAAATSAIARGLIEPGHPA